MLYQQTQTLLFVKLLVVQTPPSPSPSLPRVNFILSIFYIDEDENMKMKIWKYNKYSQYSYI